MEALLFYRLDHSIKELQQAIFDSTDLRWSVMEKKAL
jgi:hypothetical protein